MALPSRNTQGGFTLIELLGTIAIVALLGSLLYPMVDRMRQGSAKAACATKLRQVGAGISAYASENDTCLPWGYSGNAGYWSSILDREGFLSYGTKGANVYACPGERVPPTWSDKSSWVRSNFIANPNVMPEQKNATSSRVRVAKIPRPAEVVIITDGAVNGQGNSDWGFYSQPEVTSRSSEQYQDRPVPDAPSGAGSSVIKWRHGDRANFLFVDGHVEAIKAGELLQKNIQVKY